MFTSLEIPYVNSLAHSLLWCRFHYIHGRLIIRCQRHRCEAEGFKSHKQGAAEAALFASVVQYFESVPFDPTDKIRCTNLPPIYFQHRGHSLTIVGLEKRSSGSLKLLVFDPMFHDPEGVLRLVGRVGRHGSTKEDKNSKTRNPIMHRSPDSALKLYRRGNNYLRKYHEFELLRYVLLVRHLPLLPLSFSGLFD